MKLPRRRELTPAQVKARASIGAYQLANPPPLSPCVDQSSSAIANYYREAEIGGAAVVRHTQGGLLRYDRTVIDGRNPRAGRVYVTNGGAFYMKSGANCFHPKGQTTLVVPTVEVLDWIAEHPNGEFGMSLSRRD